MRTVATFYLLSNDAAEKQSVVSRAQYGEMAHGGTARDIFVHGFHDLGFAHPYTSNRSGAVDWLYSDMPYRLRRRLASGKPRLISTEGQHYRIQ